MLLVGAVVVAVSGVVGLIVGANGSERTGIEVFGLAMVPATPAAVAVYAMALSATVLAALFAAVELASRFEEADRG